MDSMSMSMSGTDGMSGMPMATSTDGSMPMSTSSSGEMTMGMNSMTMVFFTSTTTPLWSTAFQPNTTGQYAGACIFLIAFAAIFRGLLAIRVNFFEILGAAQQRRSGGLLQAYTNEPKAISRPWKAGEATMLATMDLTLAGLSYLLMLAVMTFNVGYFLSILSGVFLGSLVFGRFTGSSGAH